MTNYYEIVAALAVALFLTVLFSLVLRHKGPWGALWLVFVVIFLSTWAADLWITPFGPTILGVAIVPIFIVGLIFAFILAATTLPARQVPVITSVNAQTAEPKEHTIGFFFWVVLITLVIAIAAGYYRMPENTRQLVK